MRIYLGLAVMMLAAPCRSETPAYDEAKVIAYSKTIDVAKLDPTLRSQPFEEWLRVGPARVETMEWRMSDCDLKPDYREPAAGYPLCVKVVYQRRNVAGWIIITIGTKRKGIVEPPRFESAVVSTRSTDGMRFENADKLSDLPRAISKLLAESGKGPGLCFFERGYGTPRSPARRQAACSDPVSWVFRSRASVPPRCIVASRPLHPPAPASPRHGRWQRARVR